jgi:hypothetical protein
LDLQFKRANFMKGKDIPASTTDNSESGSQQVTGIMDISSMKKMYANRLGLLATERNSNNNSQMKIQIQKLMAADPDQFSNKKPADGTIINDVTIPELGLTLRDLASKLSMKIDAVKKKLEDMGEDLQSDAVSALPSKKRRRYMKRAKTDDSADDKIIDADVAELLVLELGISVTREKAERDVLSKKRAYSNTSSDAADTSNMEKYPPRHPIVCVMGHVDHGTIGTLSKM